MVYLTHRDDSYCYHEALLSQMLSGEIVIPLITMSDFYYLTFLSEQHA